MATYITLLRYTSQGAANVKDSPARLDAGREAFKKFGVEIKDTYLLMGRYDLLCVIEAPDDETLAKCILTLGSQGNVETETMKAWNEDDFRRIVASV
ncbi:MAG TPA: GYD domain-containing protein [Pyrinomonadaceae bacterium]|nr:GYD domain-containing protein [Pyrinomonadaceae bacterium]